MIKKFIKISGTGKFLDYNYNTPPPNFRTTDFERLNLIYGENGSGKTTVSVILNSLKGDNALLTRKRAFNKTFPQTIEVLTDASTPKLTYQNNVWDGHYPNIEIFDIHFINENIYTGLEIQTSHKKKLFEIIFGLRGITLKGEIQLIKDRIQKGNQIIRETTEKIEFAIDKTYSGNDFCNVQIDAAIESKISAKEAQITTAKNFQIITTKPSLASIQTLTLPFDSETVADILLKSIDTISDDYLLKFKTHKEHLEMDGKEEEWLKQGYEAIKDETCPFCLRPFDESVEILEAYKQYFNEEYNNLLKSIEEIGLAISSYNLESYFLSIENKISANINLIEFWKTHIPNSPTLTSIIQERALFLTAYEKVKEKFKLKSENPIQVQDTSAITEFKKLVEDFTEKINDFNTAITAYNQLITSLKTSTQPNLTALETELKKLKAVKKRSDTIINGYCTNLVQSKQAVLNLNTEKDAKQSLLDNYSATIFANYSTKINLYLRAFAPYLEIRRLESSYVGSSKEPMIKYALHINGNEIWQDDNIAHATFKYSLSEGDKSALALAFFLTKLELDTNIQDKIIVFDDPVSSFDLNRKSTTINKLLYFGQKAKQLFVLTHNIIFAGEFWKSANQISLTSQCSKIEFLGNSSCIVEFYIDNETLSSVLKDCTAIKNYLLNGCITDQERRNIARCIRPALESYFHLKFFDLILPTDWMGVFIAKVRNSTATDPFNKLIGQVQEMTDINDYSKKYHHRHNTNADIEPISDAELRNYCERTLNLIQLI
ncbi:MAG TPA: AAA family ATPase [Hanamia sp.]